MYELSADWRNAKFLTCKKALVATGISGAQSTGMCGILNNLIFSQSLKTYELCPSIKVVFAAYFTKQEKKKVASKNI